MQFRRKVYLSSFATFFLMHASYALLRRIMLSEAITADISYSLYLLG